MSKITILLLLASVLIAGGLAYYQYLIPAKNKKKIHWFLAGLRFLALLGIFILLINPLIKYTKTEIVKTNLPIVVDNSKSVKLLKADEKAMQSMAEFQNNKALSEKYNLQFFQFSSDVKSLDSLDFKGNFTQIDKIPNSLKQLYKNENYPIVLISDGNQTLGDDYVYSFTENTQVYPVILGDTTSVFDLKVNQLNVNKYAFLKNQFPVEVYVQSNSDKPINTTVLIQQNGTSIAKQSVSFSSDKKSEKLSFLLDATSVGVKKYTVLISSNQQEKNTKNNSKPFVVEVIDQRTEVAIISAINHPDIGTLKRSIEVNQQRKVTLVNPNKINDLSKFNELILYQPNTSFKSVFEQNKNLNLNTFIITGLATDFNFLNQYVTDFSFKMNAQKEYYLADFSSNFNVYSQDNIGFENLPPLENAFGIITPKTTNSTLLDAKIRNTDAGFPLLSFTENNGRRNAYLFGEGIWKWRMETYLNKKSFDDFDSFTDKIIQYLATQSNKKSLIVSVESFYNSGEPIEITAQYFNKNYEFDSNAELTIKLTNKDKNTTKTYNFYNGNFEYKVNFDGLEAGNYTYTLTEKSSNTSTSGSFEVLAFDIEEQFTNPDSDRLELLAKNTSGSVYYPNTTKNLIDFLLKSDNYKPTAKEITQKTPLIDWKWLLGVIVVLLGLEWFIRKYNGLY